MPHTTVNQFRQNLKAEVDAVVESHQVLHVQRRVGEDFVVLSESDWRAIEETLYLNSIPGMADSIRKGLKEPIEEGTSLEDIDW